MTLKFLIETELYPRSPSAGFTRGPGGLPGEGRVLVHAAGSPATRERLEPGRELNDWGRPASGQGH